jgi:GNAT superfamily N-acetyltransferase
MKTSQSKPPGAVAVRHATAEDVPEIVQLLWDDEQGRQRESTSLEQASNYLSAFEQIECDPNSQLFVATLDEAVVGCLQLTVIPGLSYRGIRRALVEDVRVAQSYRGRGLGGHLLSYAEAQATDLGCGLVELFVHSNRNDAHRFYERARYTGAHRGFRKKLG